MESNQAKTLQNEEEARKHVFVHLVALQDYMDSHEGAMCLEEFPTGHAEELIDYLWDDELKHYQEELAGEFDDLTDEEEVMDHARGYHVKAICDTHGDAMQRMVRVNEAQIYTCRECDQED